ncbi:4Fe-4S binding protein [Promethearchaeum syntrophicum]|uniref:CoB--CoM heterodisulfide reductase iron-sulfur subunit A n=1 Tax=Promethearchaeum syntrophicum TaxID=2594042 RepID=A0A5B9DCX2_9ARCH|nr:CoB--CoM heterodisulfide reductase iron-sulfur subunit A family protein [Candidatus Prometheoarchaeum syntrophicum]QEE16974.1 CoB--CoM heterodisulfide reductase iron-sulfur subunit A [Candidatus Prometheoarchaeum syntrophicum]
MTESNPTPISKLKSPKDDDVRIGLYICNCGINIGGVLQMDDMVEFGKTLPNVTLCKQYKFYCSDNGQAEIAKDIKDGLVNRIVVAACSPRMHEPTFRRVLKENGLNPFYFAQANIREHATWVNMYDHEGAQRIAKDHIRMQVAKVRKLKALETIKVKVKPSTLVIGAGIAGMNSALDLADQGFEVFLVERELTIGGHMAQLDKTFPTMDCSSCILTPKMVDVSRNPNIHIMAYSEVEQVDGYVGNFEVKIKHKAHYVDQLKCTGCGACVDSCPVICANSFDLNMSPRKAIYIPFPQAVPGQFTIDIDHCIKCGICALPNICEPGAINYDEEDHYSTIKVGTIIVSTGYDQINPTNLKNYGYGVYENVITGLEMERNLSSTGPNLGKPVCPSNGKPPHSVAWLQCVGSRDNREGYHKYCSRVCCMYAIKQARQYKEKHPEAECYIFYMDIRAFGKGYEEFYESSSHDFGIKYMRGRLAEIYQNPDKTLLLRGEDTFLSRPIAINVDLVVLSTGVETRSDSSQVASMLGIQQTSDGFFMEAHPKLRPVDCLTAGIFVAGVAQGPKDIPDAVSQAKGAASGAAILMAKGEVEVDPYYAVVQANLCSGCRSCINLCPYNAISFDDKQKVAYINPIMCHGCGTCVASCPSNAIYQNHFTGDQLMTIITDVLGGFN